MKNILDSLNYVGGKDDFPSTSLSSWLRFLYIKDRLTKKNSLAAGILPLYKDGTQEN